MIFFILILSIIGQFKSKSKSIPPCKKKAKCRENENLWKDKRVEDGEEKVDCKEVEEDGWLHSYHRGDIPETEKHVF